MRPDVLKYATYRYEDWSLKCYNLQQFNYIIPVAKVYLEYCSQYLCCLLCIPYRLHEHILIPSYLAIILNTNGTRYYNKYL